jgi:hypothetical protein
MAFLALLAVMSFFGAPSRQQRLLVPPCSGISNGFPYTGASLTTKSTLHK